MKKYISVVCSKCKKTNQLPVDNEHYKPDRCSLTKGCEGRLYPTEYSSIPGSVSASEFSQFQLDINPTRTQPEMYSLSCGKFNQLVFATDKTDPLLTISCLSDQYESGAFLQYTFRVGATIFLSGVEAAAEKKVLRYSSTDQVIVNVNGIRLDKSRYQLCGEEGVPANTIKFVPGLTAVNSQIDVIISKNTTPVDIDIVMTKIIKDEGRVDLGCWEGVETISINNKSLNLYYADLAETILPLANTHLWILTDINGGFLLARSNKLLAIDRELTGWIPISMVKKDATPLFVLNSHELGFDNTLVKSVYPPITASFNTPNVVGEGKDDGSFHQTEFIIGPV